MSTGRLASVVNQLAMLRTGDLETNLSRATQLAGVVGTAREAATRYREAVLAYDDLSRKLCALFGLSNASHWNGYVPPRADRSHPPGKAHEYNTSPYRAQLVAIVEEALNRSGDWRHYDSDRLATVPAKWIESPWTEPREGRPPPRKAEGLWPE